MDTEQDQAQLDAPNRPLFRPQAMRERQQGWLGETRLAVPPSFSLWATVSLIFVVVMLVWMISGTYTRRERVKGYVVPESGLVRLRAKVSGEIGELHVREGDRLSLIHI